MQHSLCCWCFMEHLMQLSDYYMVQPIHNSFINTKACASVIQYFTSLLFGTGYRIFVCVHCTSVACRCSLVGVATQHLMLPSKMVMQDSKNPKCQRPKNQYCSFKITAKPVVDFMTTVVHLLYCLWLQHDLAVIWYIYSAFSTLTEHSSTLCYKPDHTHTFIQEF